LNQNKGNIQTAKARQLQAEVSVTVALREVERKIAGELHAYEQRVMEISKWPPDAAEKFREAARTADEHYRLGAIPVATYTELQKQYLDVVDAILSTQEEALASRQRLQLLTGLDLGDMPSPSAPAKSAITPARK
jgi:cobalt-zinc-cadmium efflux system outer membrane protein